VAAGSVALTVRRLDGLSGAAVVSTGIPLVPGALPAGQEGRVRLVLDGVEQAVYATGLHSRHKDGSLRAVLVQFRVASLGAGEARAARLELASGPRAAALTLGAPLAAPAALPAAVALPTEPAYLIATDLVGATRPAAEAAALGGAYARFEADFRTYGDQLWASEGATLAANYYDRALIYYAAWARSGDPTYWWRATQLAVTYRRTYLEPNDYGSSPHMAQLEGLEKHYLLTGDEASRVAVIRTADKISPHQFGYLDAAGGESRIAARLVHSALLAYRLTPPGAPALELMFGPNAWGPRLDGYLGQLYAWQAADGSYPAASSVCGGQLNYMVGMLNEAFTQVHAYYRADARLVDAVRRAADYMWATQWRAEAQAFSYASVLCAGTGGPDPAPDLNNLLVNGYGWLYRQTGDPKYRAAAEQIFAGAVAGTWLAGSKQFNQQYTTAYRHFAYR
jgi:hypothetical protein